MQKAAMPASVKGLRQMAIFITVFTGGGCATMYYLMQTPPLKVYNIHLTDRHNRIDHTSAQIKIPVTGTKTGGYLYTTSFKDNLLNRWRLHELVLQLREGQQIDILSSSTETSERSGEPNADTRF
ncbi:hypothetical protein JZ751_000823 [Albula glossodonta]|uniref:Uncharacterized protein n=1 Tax=Albula glossodonta TaxID=121402 RepID=A0A8T2PX54_9TELE|nr:hypothetical protein JZ751_000823 [Albula glossodonta]